MAGEHRYISISTYYRSTCKWKELHMRQKATCNKSIKLNKVMAYGDHILTPDREWMEIRQAPQTY